MQVEFQEVFLKNICSLKSILKKVKGLKNFLNHLYYFYIKELIRIYLVSVFKNSFIFF